MIAAWNCEWNLEEFLKVQRGTNTRQGDWQLELGNERGSGAWKSAWRRGVETSVFGANGAFGLGGVAAWSLGP